VLVARVAARAEGALPRVARARIGARERARERARGARGARVVGAPPRVGGARCAPTRAGRRGSSRCSERCRRSRVRITGRGSRASR
jgi:hypothetical protein